MDTSWILTGIVGVVTYVIISGFMKKRGGPPGPFPLPIIGTLYKHKMNAASLMEMGRIYGPVFSVFIGSKRVIILDDYSVIRESMRAQLFVDRGQGNTFCKLIINPRCKGLVLHDNDPELVFSRRHSLAAFRELGVGRSTLETEIARETQTLLTKLRTIADKNDAVDLRPYFGSAVANIILGVLFKVHYNYDNKDLLNLIQATYKYFQASSFCMVIDKLTILRYMEPFKTHLHNYIECNTIFLDFLWKHAKPIIEAGNDRLQSEKTETCFVEKFVGKIASAEKETPTPTVNAQVENSDTKKGRLSMEQFRYMLKDLLIAGFETTATSMLWAVLYMANRPHVQKRLQAELDAVLDGNSYSRADQKVLTLSDRERLPYLEAVVHEVLRLGSVAPLMFYRSSRNADTVIPPTEATPNPTPIPRNTSTFANYYSVHRNPQTWSDPEDFRPERFLNEEGKFMSHPHMLPFGIGKRVCVGELLARQELFLFTGMVFHEFSFAMPEGIDSLSETGTDGLTRSPLDFRVKVQSRRQ